ncbi:MAG: hypothetical protein HF978_14330 [Desulfobacteraceae bacterium]|nr:hypothetical protein [Desulfobacteraceae bacterium]MBC2756716.1 hypothetical protein [Desulfobacteraceae bacterium]
MKNFEMTGTNDLIDDSNVKDQQFLNGEGKGVQMKKWKPFTDFVLSKLVKKAEIINGEALLPTDDRPVVAIASHGPNVAWMPLVALVGKFFNDNGHGNIIGGMYPHKALFLIPGLKGFYKRVLGTPTNVNTVDDIVDLLKNNEIGLTGTAPEGANCLLSFNEYVAPFRSKGMIAAAIKADTSICLMAHQGAEDWNIRADLPFGWSVPFTNGLKGINIPLPPYKKINRYIVLCRRYKPSITSADLKNKTKREARLLLNIEIERIRAEMNLMTDEVKELMRKKTVKLKLAKPQKAKPWQNEMLQIYNSPFPPDEAYC